MVATHDKITYNITEWGNHMEKIKNIDKKLKIIAVIIVTFICLIGCMLIYYVNGVGSVSSHDEEVVIEIPKGSNGADILDILDENDLLKSRLCAKIYLKMHHYDFKSNGYILNKNMDLSKILSVLEGKDKQYISNIKITVIDGQTIPEFAKSISKATNIKYDDIMAKWSDKTYLQSLIEKYWFLTEDILQDGIYYPLEGYLAPETYFLTSQTDNIESITTMMLDQMEKHLSKYKEEINAFQAGNQKLSIHQFITLASIIQRESPANNEDRALIAGVLINRLNKPMRLQSDVTVNYGNQVTKVDVSHNDLNTDTKYNTYRYDGLPIGPISALSTDTIEDTLHYQQSEYYFFFATQDQKVLYAKTYKEHLENVNKNKWY